MLTPERPGLQWQRKYGLWGVVFVALSAVVMLGFAERKIVVNERRINARLTLARTNIVAVTDLRRDGRKTQVAILERWLSPRERWSAKDDDVLRKLAGVVRSTRAFAVSPTLMVAQREQKMQLLAAVTAWSETTNGIIAYAKDPNSLALLNERFSAIDRECNAILESNTTSAKIDDEEREKLKQLEKLNGYAALALILALTAGAWIRRAKASAAARVQSAEQARRAQELISVELESRVSRRTQALAQANTKLQDNMEQLQRTQEELRSKEALYRDLFEHMQDGVVVYQPLEPCDDFVFKDVNEACLRIERLARESVIGRRLTEVFPGAREFGILDAMQRVSNSGIPEYLPAQLYQDQRISGWRESLFYRLPTGELVAVYRDVSNQKVAEMSLRSALETTQKIVDAVPFAVVLVGNDGHVRRANDAAGAILKSTPSALVGKAWREFFVPTSEAGPRRIAEEVSAVDADGRAICVLLSEIPVMIEGEEVVIEAFADLSERRRLETQLRHAQKLESVGQLAAGIAHEINTPAQYVGDSIQFLAESFQSTRGLVAKYRRAVAVLHGVPGHEQLAQELKEAEGAVDLAYIEEHAPAAFEGAADGIARIATIVSAMKEFAHPDDRAKRPTDLNRAIQTTLTIARNEYKYVADVQTEFGTLPPVPCHVGDVNQVILNLLVNAAHAISDIVGSGGDRGTILVRTAHEGNLVRIDIADTGAGILPAIRGRIFDPFFTTKEVGKGSGQGLAIARSIIVDKHGGSLSFVSEMGKGTTFTILLPLDGSVVA